MGQLWQISLKGNGKIERNMQKYQEVGKVHWKGFILEYKMHFLSVRLLQWFCISERKQTATLSGC